MSEVFKLLGTEQVCNTTANTISNAKLVRLVNTDTAAWVITCNSATGNATCTLAAGNWIVIEKQPTDVLTANTAAAKVYATPVAYKN